VVLIPTFHFFRITKISTPTQVKIVSIVIPAQAGIYNYQVVMPSIFWIPACAPPQAACPPPGGGKQI
jgi:hypothetical protein